MVVVLRKERHPICVSVRVSKGRVADSENCSRKIMVLFLDKVILEFLHHTHKLQMD